MFWTFSWNIGHPSWTKVTYFINAYNCVLELLWEIDNIYHCLKAYTNCDKQKINADVIERNVTYSYMYMTRTIVQYGCALVSRTECSCACILSHAQCQVDRTGTSCVTRLNSVTASSSAVRLMSPEFGQIERNQPNLITNQGE